MTTILWATGFEYGISTPTVNGAGLADTLAGTPTIVGSGAAHNNQGYALSIVVASGASTAYLSRAITSTSYLVGSFYMMIPTGQPAHQSSSSRLRLTIGGTSTYIYIDPQYEDLYWYQTSYNGDDSNIHVVPGTYSRIDFRANGPAKTVDWMIDGVNQTQFVHGISGAITDIRFQTSSTQAAQWTYFDDIVLSNVPEDYPIGAHYIVGSRPDADGTHNAGTNIMEDNAGNDIGAVSAYPLVNANPWVTSPSTYIRQNATGSGRFAEIQFADSSYTSPIGGVAVLQYRSSATTANEGATIITNEDGTETTVWGSRTSKADYSESSSFYKYAVLPTPAGGWDVGAVNALKSKMGFSNNVASVPYWTGLITELVYAGDPGPSTGLKVIAGAEYGLATISTSGTGLFDGAGGTAVQTSSTYTSSAYSNYSYKFSATSNTCWVDFQSATIGSPTVQVGSAYVLFTGWPSTDLEIVGARNNTASTNYVYLEASTKKIGMSCAGSTSTVNLVLASGIWYRIDWKIDISANPWTMDLQVNGAAATQTTSATAANTHTTAWLGWINSDTATMYIDDYVLSVNATDYPIGGHTVFGSTPAESASYGNPGTNILKDSFGGDIGAANRANAYLATIPWTDSDSSYVAQIATGSGNFGEFAFDTQFPYGTPQRFLGTRVLLMYAASGVTANTGGFYVVNQSGAKTTIWGTPGALADYSETAKHYKSAMLPDPEGGWDEAAIDALVGRVGFSDNATSQPRWYAVLAEVAVADIDTGTDYHKHAYTRGKLTSVDNQFAYTEGAQNTKTGSKSAYTIGGIKVVANKYTYTRGSSSSSDNQYAYVRGSSTTRASKSAYLKGATGIVADKDVYTKGKSTTVANKAAYTKGSTSVVTNKAAFTRGGVKVVANKAAYTRGGTKVVANKAAYARGGTNIVADKDAFTKGRYTASGSKSAYTRGSSVLSSSKAAYTRGGTKIVANKAAYIGGKLTFTASKSAFTNGKYSSVANKAAYTKGSSTYSSSKSAYTRGGVKVTANKAAYTRGGIVVVANKDAYTRGRTSTVANKFAYTRGKSTSIANKAAYTKGSISSNASKSAFTQGSYRFEIEWVKLALPPSQVLTSSASKSAYIRGKAISNEALPLTIIATNPISYFPLNDPVGSDNAKNYGTLGSPEYDGDYTQHIYTDPPTLEGALAPNNYKAPVFDSNHDHVDLVHTRPNMNQYEGSILVFIKVPNDVWSDGASRFAISFGNGGGSHLVITKDSSNQIRGYSSIWLGDVAQWYVNPDSKQGWMSVVLTWSQTNNRNRMYFNGVQVGSDHVGVFVPLTWDEQAVIGDIYRYDSGGSNRWIGSISHVAIWNRELSPDEILAINNSSRLYISAFARGKSFSSASKSAYIKGQELSLHNKSAYTKGKLDTSATKSAYTKGQSSYTTSKFAYTKGRSTFVTNKYAYTRGKLDSVANRYAYTSGKSSVSYNKSAYTEGKPVEQVSSRFAYTKGKLTVAYNKYAFTKGQSTNVTNKFVYTKGQSSAVFNKFVYTKGKSSFISNKSAYTKGKDSLLASKFAYTKGSSSLAGNKAAFTRGGIIFTGNKAAYTRGKLTEATNRFAYTRGSSVYTTSKFAYTKGISGASTSRFAYTGGKSTYLVSKSAFTLGKSTSIANKSAYVRGSSVQVANKSAFTKGKSTYSSSKSAYLRGGVIQSSSKFAFTRGKLDSASNKWAYTRGSSVVVSNKWAYTKGRASLVGNKPAYLIGKSTYVSSKFAYLRGSNILVANKPAYIASRVNITDVKHAYTEGYAPGIASQKAYTRGLESNSYSHSAFTEGSYEFEIEWVQVGLPPSQLLQVTASKSAYIAGESTIKASKSAYVRGQIHISSVSYKNKVIELLGNNLLGYYPLDELSGLTVYDYSGNNYNGVYESGIILGEPGLEEGRFTARFDNGSANFSSSDLIDVIDDEEGSILIWAKITTEGWNTGAWANVIEWKEDWNQNLGRDIRKWWNDNGIGMLGGTKISCTDTNWIHLVCTWSLSQDKLIFYINGNKEQEVAYISVPSTWGVTTATIGGTSGFRLIGKLSHAIYLNKFLTQDEITALSNSTGVGKHAYLRGESTYQANKSAFTRGKDTTSAAKSAYVEGRDIFAASKQAFTKGKDTSAASKSAYTRGKDTLVANKQAYTKGKDIFAANKSAYIKGKDTTSSSKIAFTRGGLIIIGNKAAYLKGAAQVTHFVHAYLNGFSGNVASKSAYTKGKSSYVDNKSAYLRGASALQANRYAYTKGKDTYSASKPAYIVGKTSVVYSRYVYTRGSSSFTSSKFAYTNGGIVTRGNKSAFIAGKDTTSGYVHAYLNGFTANTTSKFAYTRGKSSYVANKAAFTRGGIKASKSAYTKGSITAVDSKHAYIAGQSSKNSQKFAYLRGKNLVIYQKSAYIHGKSTYQALTKAYLCGKIVLSGNRAAYIKGRDVTSASKAAYISGKSTTNTSSVHAYLKGGIVVADSQPAFIAVRAIVDTYRHAYLIGFLANVGNKAAFTYGAELVRSTRHAYISGTVPTILHIIECKAVINTGISDKIVINTALAANVKVNSKVEAKVAISTITGFTVIINSLINRNVKI